MQDAFLPDAAPNTQGINDQAIHGGQAVQWKRVGVGKPHLDFRRKLTQTPVGSGQISRQL